VILLENGLKLNYGVELVWTFDERWSLCIMIYLF